MTIFTVLINTVADIVQDQSISGMGYSVFCLMRISSFLCTRFYLKHLNRSIIAIVTGSIILPLIIQ